MEHSLRELRVSGLFIVARMPHGHESSRLFVFLADGIGIRRPNPPPPLRERRPEVTQHSALSTQQACLAACLLLVNYFKETAFRDNDHEASNAGTVLVGRTTDI